ncbi:putative small lipoprotein YifL [Rhizorhapis suberifaciens]|uniref:Putative small lipoprotein YifL n=2 Tax=Rhizorhapis suberifaciens TaxID=13656 RepID=A0A840HVP0_9SPHN|nr:putative small lipoprotein YifL [Rhizorhapis suberifaciens]
MLRSDLLLWEPYNMNKFAVVFAAAGLMALAACGEKPAEETANASNAVVENVVENAAVPMENAAENATSNAVENAAE